MNLTDTLRSLDSQTVSRNFAGLKPSRTQRLTVDPGSNHHLIARDALTAGIELHHLLTRLFDESALTRKEAAYLPFFAKIRDTLREDGIYPLQYEQRLKRVGILPHGRCDVLGLKTPHRHRGIVELKLTDEIPDSPKPIHLEQAGLLAALVAGHRSYRDAWACIAYVCPRQCEVVLYHYDCAERLIWSARNALATLAFN